MLCVRNTGLSAFEDGYAGERYSFPPGVDVEIPEEAARHIFGHGEEDKTPFLARLGWIMTQNELPSGIERLEKFVIHDSLSPVVARVPQTGKRGGGKPLVVA